MRKWVLTFCLAMLFLFFAVGCEPKSKESEEKGSGSSPSSGFGFEVDKPQVAKSPESWFKTAEEKKIFQEYEKHFYPAVKLTPNEKRDYALSQWANLKAQQEGAIGPYGSMQKWREEVARNQKKMNVAKR